jgi:arginase
MSKRSCILLGAPVQEGAGRLGCDMGPSAFRAAGLAGALENLGHAVIDRGNLAPAPTRAISHGNLAIKALPEIVAWTESIAASVYRASAEGMPIVLGGDHSLGAGVLSGLSRRAAEMRREFFVLWLDAHPDFHTLETTRSGHLHGVPMAYATGQPGFSGVFPPLAAPVKPGNVCMMGIRSADPAERAALASADPGIAPGVGTTVPGGATFREAHLVMEMLHDSGLVASLDLVELNPFLDERGRTAVLLVDLVASLMGRRVMDRPTRSY